MIGCTVRYSNKEIYEASFMNLSVNTHLLKYPLSQL